jgi:hypothetical protein
MRTLIVRVFEPAPEAGPVPLHGVVEDVRSGTTRSFRGEAQLLAALRQEMDPAAYEAGTVGPADGADSHHRAEHPEDEG